MSNTHGGTWRATDNVLADIYNLVSVEPGITVHDITSRLADQPHLQRKPTHAARLSCVRRLINRNPDMFRKETAGSGERTLVWRRQ